jgi:superfamily II DNA or RNA helicase
MQLTVYTPPPAIKPVLRDDQSQVKREIYNEIRNGHKRIMAVCPCGWGKTRLAISLCYDMTILRNYKVLFLVHAECLVDQTIEAMAQFKLWAGAIAGSRKEHRKKNIQVAMIQTLERGRDISWFKPDFIISDEVHELCFRSWHLQQFPRLKDGEQIFTVHGLDDELRILGINVDKLALEGGAYPSFKEVTHAHKVAAKANHPDVGGDVAVMRQINSAWDEIRKHKDLFSQPREKSTPTLIGLTATPWRLSKRESMGDIFSTQALGPTPGQMIAMGKGVPYIYWGIEGADLDKIHTTYGDFNEQELVDALSVPDVIQTAVRNYKEKALGRRFICFPVRVDHAKILQKAFSFSGIETAVIEGNTPANERKLIYEQVKSKKILGIISVGCVGIGFDLPEISCIIDCCPTKSIAKYLQKAGRGGRIAPWDNKEDCIYLDQAGNVTRHFMVEDTIYPELRQSSTRAKGEPLVKVCPQCGRILQISLMECIACGFKFEAPEKEEAVGNMILLVRESEKPMLEHFRILLKRAFKTARKPNWAVYQLNQKFKGHPAIARKSGMFWPPKGWYYQAIFGECTPENIQAYLTYLQDCTKADRQPPQEWWYKSFLSREFGEGWQHNH